jgi:hypothetical protein
MRFWVRELAGWLLMLLGLYLFLVCIDRLLNARWILEPIPLLVIGIVVFRGGIHLLKVAVAARICSQVHERSAAPRRPARPLAAEEEA